MCLFDPAPQQSLLLALSIVGHFVFTCFPFGNYHLRILNGVIVSRFLQTGPKILRVAGQGLVLVSHGSSFSEADGCRMVLEFLQMSLLPFLWALWWLEEVAQAEAVISSDPAAALGGISSGRLRLRSDLRGEILTQVYRLERQGRKVRLLWVPAHVEIEGNEKADRMAKAALKREEIDVWVSFGRHDCGSKMAKLGVETYSLKTVCGQYN